MPECLIALGGNLGDVRAAFRSAVEALTRAPGTQVDRVSRSFLTRAVGASAGGSFYNAAVRLTTSLAPLALLDLLQSIETAQGRVREIHWGPRTLDLDIVLYGQMSIRAPRLSVPHPACWYRRFVLDPIVDIAGEVTHPEFGLTFQALRERLLPRPLPVALLGDTEFALRVTSRFASEFSDVRFVSDVSDPGFGLALDLAARKEASRGDLVVRVPAGTDEARADFLRYVLDSAVASPVAETAEDS